MPPALGCGSCAACRDLLGALGAWSRERCRSAAWPFGVGCQNAWAEGSQVEDSWVRCHHRVRRKWRMWSATGEGTWQRLWPAA